MASLVVVERPSLSLAGARVVTVVLMVPAVVVAWQGYSVLRLFLIADLLCASAVVPALFSLWRRATPAGALLGSIAGLVGAVLPGIISTGSFVDGIERATFPGATPTLPPFLGALIASTVVAVIVSLAGRSETDLAKVGEQLPTLGGAGATSGD
jgi:Na+/proline symporter